MLYQEVSLSCPLDQILGMDSSTRGHNGKPLLCGKCGEQPLIKNETSKLKMVSLQFYFYVCVEVNRYVLHAFEHMHSATIVINLDTL